MNPTKSGAVSVLPTGLGRIHIGAKLMKVLDTVSLVLTLGIAVG